MLFTNPKIIQSLEDVIIGGVEVGGSEIDFNSYSVKVYKRILKMVVNQVAEAMSNGNDKPAAIKEVAELVYSYLNIVDKYFPRTEEEIVDEIMKSAEYGKWQTRVYYSFMEIHKGVITEATPIEAGGDNPELKEAYSLAEEQDFLDLLQALSASFNL